jgi:hypothetical protein
MTGPPELLCPWTFPELPVAVHEKVVKGSEANNGMLVVTPEQMVEFAALVTEGLGFTLTFTEVGIEAVHPVPME